MTEGQNEALATVHANVATAASNAVDLAEARGRDDLAEALRAELASRSEPSTVVVVAGETKRGKSSLINALLGRPDLVPADAQVPTSAHILVQYGSPEHASLVRSGNDVAEEIPIDSVRGWATPESGRDNGEVRGVVISIDHPLLARGVTLVDTPGVGGLDAAHAAVTKEALRTADALLFVVDASAPLTRPELRFLEEATDRIETVIFALTKRDAYRGWAQVLADDRALLAGTRHARARFFAVSSALALEAGSADADKDVAPVLREESAIDTLEAALSHLASGKSLTLRTANLLRLTQVVLERIDELEQAVIDAATGGGDDPAAALQSAKQRAADFRTQRTQGWRVFEREIRELGQGLDLELNRALAALRSSYETKVSAGETKDIAHSLELELQAIVLSLSSTLGERAAGVVHALHSALAIEGLDGIDIARIDIGGDQSVSAPELRPRPGGSSVIDAFGSVSPAYMVAGVGFNLLGIVGVLIAGPVGLLLGGAIWAKRRSIQSQQQARALLVDAIDWARRELPPALRNEITSLKDETENALLAAIERRERELTQAIAECERVARESAAERTRSREAAVAGRKRVVDLRAEIAALRAELELAAAGASAEQPVSA